MNILELFIILLIIGFIYPIFLMINRMLCFLFSEDKENRVNCYLFSLSFLLILIYTPTIFMILTKYYTLMVPVLLFYALFAISIIYWKFKKNISKKRVVTWLLVLIIPTLIMAKAIGNSYIEKVALDKYQQKITAYIDMDIECSRWYDDAHAMLDDGRIWSFQENDFVVTKMSRYGCWNGFGSAVILFYIFTIFRFIFRKREEVGT